MAQHNAPDVHVYEIDYVDADGRPRKKRIQLVKGGRTVDEALDFLRKNHKMFNDDRGRAPRSVDGSSLRKLETAAAQQAAESHLANLPPGLEKFKQQVRFDAGVGDRPAARPLAAPPPPGLGNAGNG